MSQQKTKSFVGIINLYNLSLSIAGIALLSTTLTSAIFFQNLLQSKYTTRFCYNSPNVTVNSQCVYCAYFTFDATVLGCTGSSAVTINMTSTQAFCIIAQCLGQVRQTPVFLGRRKRSTEGAEKPGLVIESGEQNNETTSTSSESGESYEEHQSSSQEVDNVTTTELPVQTTTEIIEFTFNGQKETYIVKQEVRVEVYTPDPLYDDYALNDVNPESDDPVSDPHSNNTSSDLALH